MSSAGRIVIDGRGANPASLAGIAELPVQKYNCKKFMFHDMRAHGIQNPFQTISIDSSGVRAAVASDVPVPRKTAKNSEFELIALKF